MICYQENDYKKTHCQRKNREKKKIGFKLV